MIDTQTQPKIQQNSGLWQAQVYAVESDRYGVVHQEGCFWVSLALSCLIIPQVGDRVLVSQSGTMGFIVAVLQRTKPSAVTVQLPAQSRLTTQDGCLQLDTPQGLHLQAGSRLTIQAQIQQQFLGSRITHIAGHDEIQAQSQRLVVAQEWRVRSKTAEIRAQQRATIDAERIQLG